jgi:DNA segregation ATPase FtsK/SpoIIIE, S-DNA-T family
MKFGYKRAFLPAGSVEAFHRTGLRTGGLGLAVFGMLVLTSLMTSDSHDPSSNSTGLNHIHNALGQTGAWIADWIWQIFGFAGLLIFVIPTVWGLTILSKNHVPTLWRLRIALFPFALFAWASFLSPLPLVSQSINYAGGALGLVIDAAISSLLPPELSFIVTILALLAALASTYFVLGLSIREWGSLGSYWRATSLMALKVINLLKPKSIPSKPQSWHHEPQLDRNGPDHSHVDWDRADTHGQPDDLPVALTADDTTHVIIERRLPPAQPGKREQAARQPSLNLDVPDPLNGYQLPPLEMLTVPPLPTVAHLNQDSLAQNARMLETILDDFGVSGQVVKVRPGPVVTLYELEPAPGTKTSRVIGLADDIARSMCAIAVRIATIPGRNVIGIELPNSLRETVFLRELLAADLFEKAAQRLSLVLGKDIGGLPVMVDLARMPHLLIAGTTGSGKSVAINTMILSLLYRLSPDECRMIMIDPKMLELSVYDGIPHLLAPVVTEPAKAIVALKWAVREMEDRYRAMSQVGVRNIQGYNQRLLEALEKGETLTRTVQTGFDPESGKPVYEDQILALSPLPFIVIIVDEMADLMIVAGKEVEGAIQRLAQMARAAGIHLIMATQRPSVDVITGTIKANFPTRISFQVTSKIDSRTILGEQGAEQLLGQGDMLYMAPGGRITRIHGPFVSDREVELVVEHLRSQGQPNYVDSVTEDQSETMAGSDGGTNGNEGYDEFYDQAVALIAREGKASTSFVQRHFQIGYNRAARIIEKMESEGVISKPNRVGKREVLVSSPD